MKPKLYLTQHAQMRKQQRGVSDMAIRLLSEFGTDHYQKGGCSLSYIDEKTIRQIRSALDNIQSLALVKTPKETVATVMRVDKKIRTTEYCV